MQCLQPTSDVLTLRDGRSVALHESLGRGSFGVVYRGVLESGWGVQRPVAVKLFHLPPEIDPAEAMRHLVQIARRAVSIRHPAFLELLEIDQTDASDRQRRLAPEGEQPFWITEHVEGESLASLVEAWRGEGVRVPIDFATVVTLRAAEALGAALFSDCVDGSLTSLVHGDLSPRQILLSSQGDVKVGDFGLSPIRDTCSQVRSRTRLAYTAPEIASGGTANARSDVFSLGVILHELLVGPRFAQGTSLVEASRMVRDGHIHANVMDPNLPRGIRDVIARATARHPMERYAHARAMAFDLRREMLQLGLCDAQTCIRHAIVGWCGTRSSDRPQAMVRGVTLGGAANDVSVPKPPPLPWER